MATPRQIAANRQNARKSTGPKTQAGKNASRQNALTHGLAGDGPVVDEAFAGAAAERMEQFRSTYPTYNASDEWSLEQLTILTFRLTHAQRTEIKLVFDGQNRAIDHWDDDEFQRAEDVGRHLAKEPSRTTGKLATFKHGCLWLADAWRELLPFATPELWTEAHDQQAHNLTGHHPLFRGETPWSNRLHEYISDQIAYYQAQAEAYEADDERARQYAINGIPLEPAAALARIRRYEAALHRRYEKLCQSLTQSHKSAQKQDIAPLPARTSHTERLTLRPSDVSLAEVEVVPVAIVDEPPPPAPPVLVPTPKPQPTERLSRRERRLHELKARKRARQAQATPGETERVPIRVST